MRTGDNPAPQHGTRDHGSVSGRVLPQRGRIVVMLLLLLLALVLVVVETEYNLMGYASLQSSQVQHGVTGITTSTRDVSSEAGHVAGSSSNTDSGAGVVVAASDTSSSSTSGHGSPEYPVPIYSHAPTIVYQPDLSPDDPTYITKSLPEQELPPPIQYDLSSCPSNRVNVCNFRRGLFGRSISSHAAIHCQVPMADPDTSIDLKTEYPSCGQVRGMTGINEKGEVSISCDQNPASASYIMGPSYRHSVDHTYRCTPNTRCTAVDCCAGWPGLKGGYNCYNETAYDREQRPTLGESEWVFTTCHQDLSKPKEWEFHYIAAERPDTLKRVQGIGAKRKDTPNVLLIILDGLSRASFHRQFPLTAAVMSYFTRRPDINPGNAHETYEFMRYHILEEGTMMNMAGLLTGIPTHYSEEKQRDTWLWKIAQQQGYVTYFGRESCPQGWEFDWQRSPTVDHVLVEPFCFPGPYAWNAEHGPHCLSRRNAFDLLLQGYGQLLDLYYQAPVMGVIHADEPHESSQTLARTLDDYLARFIRDTLRKHPSTVFAITGDHGMQFGGYYSTKAGQVEHRLPPFILIIPKAILDRPGTGSQSTLNKREGLIHNQQMLTSHYDAHKTLVHLMTNFSQDIERYYPQSREGFNWEGTFNFVKTMADKHDVIPTVFPYSHSLFEPISPQRTCVDASIPELWCLCSSAKVLDLTQEQSRQHITQLTNKALSQLNQVNTIRHAGACLNMTVGTLLSARYLREKYESSNIGQLEKDYVYNDLYRIKFEIHVDPPRSPPAILEIDLQGPSGSADLSIGYLYRMDIYGKTQCRDPVLNGVARRVRMECVCAT